MVPDWLWQNIASNLISDAVVAAVSYLAWKYRKEIAAKVRGSVPVELPTQTIHAGFSPPQVRSFGPTVRTVGKDLDLRWNAEAPTSSLTKRLAYEGLDLAAFYLRQA
jgi:hypothetical protein